jgi:hypothetical protein
MTRRLWDVMDDLVLRILHGNGRDASWIAQFMCVHTSTIHRRARGLGLGFGGWHHWTRAEDAVLRRRYPDEQAATIARDFGFRVSQVHQRAATLGLHKSEAFKASDRSGRIVRGRTDPRMVATQFPKGHVPANKGLRRPGWAPGRMRETQFKKGCMAGAARAKYKPIGTDRICRDGYLERKVTDAGDTNRARQRRWVAVHRLVWEKAHGRIPRGRIVVFKPGMHTTDAKAITTDRLECITRIENMQRNSYHNRYPKEVARLIQLKGELNRMIIRRERQRG